MKHLKNSNSPTSPKKQFFYKSEIMSILFLASLIGTYLDLYFVGKGMYTFPKRLLSEVFTINLPFTLFILPLFTFITILIIRDLSWVKRWGILILISLIFPVFERLSESYGYFSHTEQWKHYYSFFGYLLYMGVMWGFYKWVRK